MLLKSYFFFMKFPILKTGLIRWVNDTKTHFGGEFSLFKWLKRAFSYVNIPYIDPCCDTDSDAPVPMRYNPDNAKMQRYDITSKTWQNICFAWEIKNDSLSPVTINYNDCDDDSQSTNIAGGGATFTVSGVSITNPYVADVTVTFIGLA